VAVPDKEWEKIRGGGYGKGEKGSSALTPLHGNSQTVKVPGEGLWLPKRKNLEKAFRRGKGNGEVSPTPTVLLER